MVRAGGRMVRGIRASLPASPLVKQKVKSGVDRPMVEVRPLGVRGVDPVPSILSHNLTPSILAHSLRSSPIDSNTRSSKRHGF